jgi:signal transduction histidine kinase
MRLSEANEAGLRLMGERRRQRDVRGMLLSEIVPGTTSGLPTLFRKAINNNQPFSSDAYECDGLRHGTAMWRFAIVPIQGTDADGAAAAALLGVDITEAVSERRALEESLQKERATTAALLDTLDVAVLVADAETSTVRFCNTAATTLGAPSSGATKGALVAEFADAWKLTAGGAPLPVDAFPLNRALRGENLIRGEFDSKGRSLTVSAVAVRGEDHRVIGGLLVAAEQPGRDVGEAAPVEAVAPAAGPAGFETLLRAVARNLATPIQAIDGMVNLFKDHYADAIPDVTALHYLELTRRNVESMSQLVTALGELASLAEREPSPTDVPLSAAVEEAWRSKPRGSAELRVEGPLPIVRADRGMLVRALTEVFDVGGLFRDGAGSTVVSVRARDLGNKWEIEVDDTGRGFRAEDAELLFGPLAQTIGDSTSTSIGGLGVGLAAARRITQLHGGEAGARASEKGAVYSLTFGK